jgi:hypothetical protein
MLALVLIYWRNTDQAAREAQKSEWLWSGTAGRTLAVPSIAFVLDPVISGILSWPDQLLSALYFAMAPRVGFLLFWAISHAQLWQGRRPMKNRNRASPGGFTVTSSHERRLA